MKRRSSYLSSESESQALTKHVCLDEHNQLLPSFIPSDQVTSILDLSLRTSENTSEIQNSTEHVNQIENHHSKLFWQQTNDLITIVDSDVDEQDEIDILRTDQPLTNSVNDEYLEIIDEIHPSPIKNTNNHELIDLTFDESEESDDQSFRKELERTSSVDIDECPICLERLTDLQSLGIHLRITSCHHVMCTPCTSIVFNRPNLCPMCRKEIIPSSISPYCILT